MSQHHAVKEYMNILHTGARLIWVVSFTLWPTVPQGPLNKRLDELPAVLNMSWKRNLKWLLPVINWSQIKTTLIITVTVDWWWWWW